MPAFGSPLYRSLVARLRTTAAQPLLTYYDAGLAERVELSAASLANAVAKTAGLLRDELDVVPGDRVAIDLPAHWQVPVWLLACAATGATAVLGHDPGASVRAADSSRLGGAAHNGYDVVVSLHPLGLPSADPLPPGAIDHAVAARAHPDTFVPDHDERPDDVVLVTASGTSLNASELGDAAHDWALSCDVSAGQRICLVDPALEDLTCGLITALADGGSLVIVRNAGIEEVAGIVASERARLARPS